MADDEKVLEGEGLAPEIADLEGSDSEEAGFMLESDIEHENETDKKDEIKTVKKEIQEQEPVEPNEEKQDKVQTAKERAEKLAERYFDPPPRREPPPPDMPMERQTETPPNKSDQSGALTKERIAEALGLVSLDDLPGGEILIGDKTINLKEFAELDDNFNNVAVLADVIANKRIEKALKTGDFVKATDLAQEKAINEQIREELKSEVKQIRLELAVSKVHSDFESQVASPEWEPWLEKQSSKIKYLAYSQDPKDAIAVLDYFKEDTAKQKVSSFDDKQRREKEHHDNLHMRKNNTRKSAPISTDIDMNDEEAGFMEAVV